jgi:hypothetical protein
MASSGDVSRAASVMSDSNARNLLKRRHKPYKTEQSKVTAKKRKLNIEVCSSFIASPFAAPSC